MSESSAEFAVSADHVISTPEIAIEPKESIGTFLFNNLKRNSIEVAQIDAETGKKDTFGEILERSIRTALHMSDRNIKRKDVITLCTKNHLNAIVPYIATQFLGAVMGSIDPSFSEQELNHLLNTIKPKMIFASSESLSLIEKVLKNISLTSEIVVFGESNKYSNFSEFLKPHEGEKNFEPLKIENLKETAVIYFSSGTTGLPKGICINHYSFIGQILNSRYTDNPDHDFIKSMLSKISSPVIQLCYTSLYWISAGAVLLNSIYDKSCRLVCKEFDGVEIWNIIEKYKPAFLMLTPVQAIDTITNRRGDVDVGCVLFVVVFGSKISKHYLLKLKEIFSSAKLGSGLGQTEVSGAILLFNSLDKTHRQLLANGDKIESVGRPVRGHLYRVVDIETGKNLGPFQHGELRLKSTFIMNGYYNSDCLETFDEDGWFKTGDIVYYDDDYCFYYIDRIKEAFKCQGWFVIPTVIEDEMVKHPAVKFAVVVGIPKEDGDHPMGVVVLKEGFTASEEDIKQFVNERVSDRQRLRAGVKFIKSVPLTVTGKINRRQLKQMILEKII